MNWGYMEVTAKNVRACRVEKNNFSNIQVYLYFGLKLFALTLQLQIFLCIFTVIRYRLQREDSTFWPITQKN